VNGNDALFAFMGDPLQPFHGWKGRLGWGLETGAQGKG